MLAATWKSTNFPFQVLFAPSCSGIIFGVSGQIQQHQEGLDPNPDVELRLSLEQQILVNITGLQALDRQIPQQIAFNFLGRSASSWQFSNVFYSLIVSYCMISIVA